MGRKRLPKQLMYRTSFISSKCEGTKFIRNSCEGEEPTSADEKDSCKRNVKEHIIYATNTNGNPF